MQSPTHVYGSIFTSLSTLAQSPDGRGVIHQVQTHGGQTAAASAALSHPERYPVQKEGT